ncbi:hypothetical protein BOX15_Mlig022447g1 [Macrostomum lignano]|uniref:Uncharacterized protein n=1 Tax=Macrostomum lignano TaxID=282301 RepID=A0A267E4L8_9PLAT|nr:hypothetical protein BOX15_Mlig022447g1 [Macrostomum lignano]
MPAAAAGKNPENPNDDDESLQLAGAAQRRLFNLEHRLDKLEKAGEHTERRLARLQLGLLLAAFLVMFGYCVYRVYGYAGLMLGATAAAGVGALFYLDDEGSVLGMS